MKRGQSAMEFLMTYGWAILVVLIVLGALFYLGVFSPKIVSSCNIQAPFVCKDIQIKENGVVVSIGSKNIQNGIVQSITVNGQDCEIIDGNLNNNQINNIECEGIEVEEGSKVSVDINIDYTKKSGLSHSLIGKGSGSVEGGMMVIYENCKEIINNIPDSEDGIYTIDPDGEGGLEEFEVYCDMENGGWTRIEYSGDLPHENRWTNGDAWRLLPSDLQTVLSAQQIQAIQAVSTEGKQVYNGTCQGVIHWEYTPGNYAYAFGFKFLNGDETNKGTSNLGVDFTLIEDNCDRNDGILRHTSWEIRDVRVPIINVYTRDNGNPSERFGSELTQNPAWLR